LGILRQCRKRGDGIITFELNHHSKQIRLKKSLLIALAVCSFSCYAQNKIKYLTKTDLKNDLAFLEEILEKKSAYQGLNGYHYKDDFDKFLKKTKVDSITKYDFEVFLAKTIGKIGDRHSNIRGDRYRDSIFFPLAFAPFKDKVLVVDYHKATKEYSFWNSEYPYLKSINHLSIEKLIPQILPGEILAPKKSYFIRAVSELRDIEKVFRSINMDLPNPIVLTLANEQGAEKNVTVKLVPTKEKARYWDERFYRNIYVVQEDKYSDKEFINKFFSVQNNIGYIQIADMVAKENSPVFFDFLNAFMTKAMQSDALIIDVRDNGGGTRDLIEELAGYFIHPDSVYVVNATRQRGELPLNEDLKESLHSRFLFSKHELDKREQQAAGKFMSSFTPMYNLDNKKFSEYYFYILNGQKLSANKYHYKKPIYILTNERSFSAASMLVSVFKGLPNVTIAGVTTDGSSGNSERFELPNSKLQGKISSMVSYQKNGKILDGIGTEPDLIIERNLDQIFWKEDYQLNKLKDIIKSQ
jgi:C-terminal processing protease CtpA/Prc